MSTVPASPDVVSLVDPTDATEPATVADAAPGPVVPARPGLETQVALAGGGEPGAEAGPAQAEAAMEPEAPHAVVEPETPKAEAGPAPAEAGPAKAEAETETEPEAPHAVVEPETPHAEAGPAKAEAETETRPEGPQAEAETETRPEGPQAEAENETEPEPQAEAVEEPQAEAVEEPQAEAKASAPTGPAIVRAAVPSDDLPPEAPIASLSRRAFIGFGLALLGGLAGAAGLARLFPVFEDPASSVAPIVPAYDPAGKRWTFVVDTVSCIGCGLCVAACKEENHVADEATFNRTWVERHVVTAEGARYVDSPEAGIHGFPPESTAPGAAGKAVTASWFVPRLCMQCENSPCTSVCPVGATYRTDDGVILVDSRRCIGCGYCVVACPYGARYLTPAGDLAPNDTPGVADKCTWCYHRISRGREPACVEVCPVGARRFGDAADPDDEIVTIVREREPGPLWPEYGTRPRVLYAGPPVREA